MSATVRIDPGNAEQAHSWDGESGAVWTTHAKLFNDSMADLDAPFFTAAAIGAGERVLDIGCGSGQTTRDAARRSGAGSALGIDLSASQLEFGRELARREDVHNVEFLQADAQVHPFVPGSFDVAISRMGAMFFADPIAAFVNVGAALRVGGRLVLLVWQDAADNDWFVSFVRALSGVDAPLPSPGSPGPFSLAVPDDVRAILGAAGFIDVELDDRREPLHFGTVDEGYALTCDLFGWRLRDLDEEVGESARTALRATLQDHLSADGDVRFESAAWIVTARRAN